ncbi:MAG: NAD(P)H-dependent oxidoreductase [Verrucomicrobiota bacterium]
MKPKILVFAGSARQESCNKKLVRCGLCLLEEAGAETTFVDLADFPMPLYDQDVEGETGIPESVKKFKAQLKDHHGFLIGCPEYNSSITPLLKNTIDWCSRAESDEEPPMVCFSGKIAGLVAASPGGLGGLRGLRHVREILGNIGTHVIPDQVALSSAYQAFDDQGALTDEGAKRRLTRFAESLVKTTRGLID